MTMQLFIILKVIILTTVAGICTCNEEQTLNAKHLASFRKLVEETSADNSSEKETGDPNNNFVSFLFQNAKEIFSNSEPTVILEPDADNDETTVDILPNSYESITKQSTYDESFGNVISDFNDLINNNSDTPVSDIYIQKSTDNPLKITDISYNLTSSLTTMNNNTDTTEKLTITESNITDQVLILEKKALEEVDQQALQSVDSSAIKAPLENVSTRRSCILCDNVASIDCMDPKNKLITSKVCDREEDLCYSMHTPFGIVDRGCFNINHNLSTYVCSCNLCNYISSSEMPYIFSGKRDWVENVKELSRTKRLRTSILKDMSCLRCEVNATLKTGDMVDNANCLEGNINTLPMQECASNEICGVRSIRSEGYIWRGCLSRPLYNYWWALCDTDLCNYDSLVSIYDDI